MDREKIREMDSENVKDLPQTAGPSVLALSPTQTHKDLLREVHDCALEQIRREEETRSLAPEAYRLSLLSDAAVTGVYRRGKECMSSADLLRYVKETRNARAGEVDLEGNTGIDECTGSNVKSECRALTVKKTSDNALPALIGRQLKQLPATLRERMPKWFDRDAADTSANTRRFPLSAFAAIAVIAASLMLIVASSVLLTRAENNLSRLQVKVDAASEEVAQMRSDYEASIDLLEIRRIAMEEYGMVEEDYVKMDYISMRGEDSVESFEEERRESVGLSALLSAIGIKK